MRILLLGEYSNVHWTLAEGLRALGHEVCVVSNGDYWKDYRRDVSLVRRSYGRWDSLVYMAQVWKALRRMRDYDVVQIINPMLLRKFCAAFKKHISKKRSLHYSPKKEI